MSVTRCMNYDLPHFGVVGARLDLRAVSEELRRRPGVLAREDEVQIAELSRPRGSGPYEVLLECAVAEAETAVAAEWVSRASKPGPLPGLVEVLRDSIRWTQAAAARMLVRMEVVRAEAKAQGRAVTRAEAAAGAVADERDARKGLLDGREAPDGGSVGRGRHPTAGSFASGRR